MVGTSHRADSCHSDSESPPILVEGRVDMPRRSGARTRASGHTELDRLLQGSQVFLCFIAQAPSLHTSHAHLTTLLRSEPHSSVPHLRSLEVGNLDVSNTDSDAAGLLALPVQPKALSLDMSTAHGKVACTALLVAAISNTTSLQDLSLGLTDSQTAQCFPSSCSAHCAGSPT